MPLKLVRRPRSAAASKKIIQDEVRVAWEKTAAKIIQELDEFVADWKNKPTFTAKVTLTEKEWTLLIKWDRRTKAGKIFGWVDMGTGEEGGRGTAYIIQPVHAKALHFYVPNYPKTMPGSPPTIMGGDMGEQEEVWAQGVLHPGITPRGFTAWIKERYGGTGPRSLRNDTDAAMKRATRKMKG